MGHWREFWCIYLYIAAFPISLISVYLLDVLSKERILTQNKNTSEFPRTNSGQFRQAHSSGSIPIQSVK